MENVKTKIQELCEFLKIRDEQLLIQVSNKAEGTQGYYTAKRYKDGYQVEFLETPPMTAEERLEWLSQFEMPFRIIQQRGENSDYVIPDAAKWKSDEELDY